MNPNSEMEIINYPESMASATRLKDITDAIENDLNQLKNEFDNIDNPNVWQSGTASQTKAKLDEVTPNFKKIHETVSTLAENIMITGRTFEALQ